MDTTQLELMMIRKRMAERYVKLMQKLFGAGLSIADADWYEQMQAKDKFQSDSIVFWGGKFQPVKGVASYEQNLQA